MRRISLLTLLLAAWSVVPKPALAVELALVLLNDVSKSMDTAEFAMVKAGYRAAFSDPEVIAAIGTIAGGVAVAYVEFSGKREIKLVQGWEVLSDAASARAGHVQSGHTIDHGRHSNDSLKAGQAVAERLSRIR